MTTKKKFVQFDPTSNKIRIGDNTYQTTAVDVSGIPFNADSFDSKLPNGLGQYLSAAQIPTKIYTLSAGERTKLAAKRAEDVTKNKNKPMSSFIEDAPAGEIGAAFGDLVNTSLNYLNSGGSKIGLLKYKLKKGVPEFASTEYRGSNGKPLSLKGLIKYGKTNYDIYTMRALRALHRLNTAMRMYKSFTKFLFVTKNYGTEDGMKKFIGATVKRRFKNTIRRIAKKQGKDIATLSTADIQQYANGLTAKINAGAQKNASNLKARVVNAFSKKSNITDATKNIVPLYGNIDMGNAGGTDYIDRPIKDEWAGKKHSSAPKQEVKQAAQPPIQQFQQPASGGSMMGGPGGTVVQNVGDASQPGIEFES